MCPGVDVVTGPHSALIGGRPVVLVLLEEVGELGAHTAGGSQVRVVQVLSVQLLSLFV